MIELVLGPQAEFHRVRKWGAEQIRDGDGLYVERGRIFLVLCAPTPTGGSSAQARLKKLAEPLGAEAKLVPVGQDDLVDSLYRRAEAAILPVEPRK